jgi:DUF438 domain-containing protein
MAKKEMAKKEKPLEKMTAKELREVAKGIDEIQGAHAMNKEELLTAIRKTRGIAAPRKAKVSMRDIKASIREVRAKAEEAKEAKDQRLYLVYRKKAARLKKKTRRSMSV